VLLIIKAKHTLSFPVLRYHHGPEDAKVDHVAALAGFMMAEPVGPEVHGECPLEVQAESQVIPAIIGVHPQRLEDAIDTDVDLEFILPEQLGLALEQDGPGVANSRK
jgi:hypothetical protein